MFNNTPQLSKITTKFINNEFNFTFNLSGELSQIVESFSNFGILLFASSVKISNYTPVYQNITNNNITFLTDDKSNYTVANNIIKYAQKYKSKFDQKNLVLYVTPFTYSEHFKDSQYFDLVYNFSNTIEIVLKIDNKVDKQNILDYTVIETLKKIDFDSLSVQENAYGAVSQLYTSFIEKNKIRNYLFINQLLLSKLQQEKISNVINYKSSIINQLLIPSVNVRNENDYITATVNIFSNFDYVTFDDLYIPNKSYNIIINYNFTSIIELMNSLILRYRVSKDKGSEISLLGLLNLDRTLMTDYLAFIQKYAQIQESETQEYDFISLFNNLYDYINASPSSKNNRKPAYDENLFVTIPFKEDKFIDLSKYSTLNNKIVSTPSSVTYADVKENLQTKQDIYNTFFLNSNSAPVFDFASVLATKSISLVKKDAVRQSLVKNNSSRLIEDFKITNQKVTINDVFSRYPTDKTDKPPMSIEQKKQQNEANRKIVHNLFGSINEYENLDNIDLNYYLQIAAFDSSNLKKLVWSDLTPSLLRSLRNDDLIFIKLIPNFSNTKVNSDIFNFSYNINQIIKVGELLTYVS